MNFDVVNIVVVKVDMRSLRRMCGWGKFDR